MNVIADLVSDFSKRGFVRRIFEGPVKSLGFSREHRADFVGVIADCDDVVELPAGEFVDRF